MPDLSLRARSATEIVDAAFQLYRRDAQQYMLVGALAYVPWVVIQFLLGRASAGSLPGSPTATMTAILTAVGAWIVQSVVVAVVTRVASDAYLGLPVDPSAAASDVLPRVPTVMTAAFGKGVLIVLGAFLLIVGAVYVALRYFAVTQVIVLERASGGDAFARSGELSRDRKGHILATLALVWLIYLALALAVGALGQLAPSPTIQLLVSTVYTIVASPLIGITETVLYYDARISGEGFDIEYMAAALDGAVTSETDAS